MFAQGLSELGDGMQGTGKPCTEALGGTGPSRTTAGLVPIPKQPGGGGCSTSTQPRMVKGGRGDSHPPTRSQPRGCRKDQALLRAEKPGGSPAPVGFAPPGGGHLPSFSSSLRTWRRTGCRFM